MNFIQFYNELSQTNLDFSEFAIKNTDAQPFFIEGANLFEPDLAKYAFFIDEGVILKYHVSPLGKILYDNFYSRNSIIGLFPSVSYFDDYFEFTTLGDIRGIKIPLTALNSYPENLKNTLLFKNLQRELFWKDAIARMLGLNVHQKIYYILSIIYSFRGLHSWDNTYSIPKYITHEVLANIANVSRTRVSYVMSGLQKKNIITYDDNNRLVILDIDFLHENCGY
ncbi:Crp/Fnr family transcriptional regulator [Listeria booriae]|uniref:Crp/Fnr family transcriptional regulator n=1 Tax=Listeria booriae TaxID=1552123 RepID=A0A841Y214_9LIST|nr:Crp/Fnr family transcriptional regulator [Listeria booriae]MBC1371333.1 Crp/Fnr family transcriptional regulator [Listeria booriae]MBC2676725.1 Crp/Fnr family transcriptional regulator [Listeria booriae]